MEMLGGNQKYHINLVELFGEENLADSILEEYVEIKYMLMGGLNT